MRVESVGDAVHLYQLSYDGVIAPNKFYRKYYVISGDIGGF